MLVWKTFKYLDELSNSICQKADLKSIFEKILQLANFALMSSGRCIGWCVSMIALFTFLELIVIIIEPSDLGTMTAFDTHDDGSFVGC